MIDLMHPKGHVKAFDLAHAEKILGKPIKNNWRLPDKSKYVYIDGVLRLKPKAVKEEKTEE